MIKAILTGHSKGLGLGIAHALLRNGHAVMGLSRQQNQALASGYPGLLQEHEVDLCLPVERVHPALESFIQQFIRDAREILLINNAGMVAPVGPLPEQNPLTVGAAVQLNIAAPFLLSSMLANQLAPGQHLKILHVSSGAGRSAYSGWSVYCATKAALDMHAQAVQLDQVPHIQICSLAPGVIDTDMQAEIRQVDSALFPNKNRFLELKDQKQLANPMKAGEQVVNYLLSPSFGSQAVADLRQLP